MCVCVFVCASLYMFVRQRGGFGGRVRWLQEETLSRSVRDTHTHTLSHTEAQETGQWQETNMKDTHTHTHTHIAPIRLWLVMFISSQALPQEITVHLVYVRTTWGRANKVKEVKNDIGMLRRFKKRRRWFI